MMVSIFKNLTTASLLVAAACTTTSIIADDAPQSRIVGGTTTPISAAPATVALLSRSRVNLDGNLFQAQFCGGTLIDQQWVLTAAHCFVDNGSVASADNFMALVGSADLSAPVTQPINVIQVIVHPDYQSTDQGFDIALLKLEFAASSSLAALNTRNIPADELVFAAGWGATNQGSSTEQQKFPEKLLGVFLQAIPGELCNTDFPDYTGSVYASNVCAYVPQGGKDSCQGDSGGPLYATNEVSPNQYAITDVIGITSWGIGCGSAQHPGVYTNVASFIDWIQNSIRSGNGGTAGNGGNPGPIPIDNGGNVPVNDTDSVASLLPDSGSAGGFMLGLLGLTLLMRKRLLTSARSRQLPAIAAILTFITATVGVQQVQATDTPSEVLTLIGQPIGEQRDDIMQGLQEKWQSEPVCTTIRTGFGKTRRAYFLETCTFKNPIGHTLWDATPSIVEYRFLENSLVQMSVAFDEMANAKKFRACAKEQNETLAKSTDKKLSINVEEDFRTTLSDVEEVDQIHSLRHSK